MALSYCAAHPEKEYIRFKTHMSAFAIRGRRTAVAIANMIAIIVTIGAIPERDEALLNVQSSGISGVFSTSITNNDLPKRRSSSGDWESRVYGAWIGVAIPSQEDWGDTVSYVLCYVQGCESLILCSPHIPGQPRSRRNGTAVLIIAV
ncbi:hypothetical protein F5Y15DRAFT_421222 [Xylariaceae sp. FL0016]|nr:hypothetical protein F5Y15DRAFT_421222 [Xylariaceae sp. FL0016]